MRHSYLAVSAPNWRRSCPSPVLEGIALAILALLALSCAASAEDGQPQQEMGASVQMSAAMAEDLHARLERALEKWCLWLAEYLEPLPGGDLYSLTPVPNTGPNAYRDVAGNQFAAAAAG